MVKKVKNRILVIAHSHWEYALWCRQNSYNPITDCKHIEKEQHVLGLDTSAHKIAVVSRPHYSGRKLIEYNAMLRTLKMQGAKIDG
jgi:hypothetical protein